MAKKAVEEKQEFTLEENFEKIEEIIQALSKDDVPLEEAFNSYSEGMQLIKNCNDLIDRVEKKVMALNEEGELEEF